MNSYEFNSVELIFISDTLKSYNTSINSHILITSNEKLLKNRLIFELSNILHLTQGNILNIVSVEESKEIMDLFLKYRNEYLKTAFGIAQETTNKGLWYWYSFRSKIPYYHVGACINEPYLDAFSNRFEYLLRSIDEIGIQHYSGVNNDTLNDTMYHFNYVITLISGIFDALALITKDKYNLKFEGDDIKSRTSLNNDAGKHFLKALREENKNLREHIHNFVNFINLIYELRELVIHRKMLEKTQLKIQCANLDAIRIIKDNGLKMNCIKIDNSILKYITHKENKIQKFKSITEWGIFQLDENYILLEPYDFSKMVLKKLINFSNQYLKLLGFKNFFEEIKNNNPEDQFIIEMESFKKGNLGL